MVVVVHHLLPTIEMGVVEDVEEGEVVEGEEEVILVVDHSTVGVDEVEAEEGETSVVEEGVAVIIIVVVVHLVKTDTIITITHQQQQQQRCRH